MYKILVVDDTRAWREFHKTNLEKFFIKINNENYLIEFADYARDGLDKLYENVSEPYNLIITDLQMEDDFLPEYAGEWFIGQIKNLTEYKNTEIIISSGSYNIKQIAESLNVEYISKRDACTDEEKYEQTIKKFIKTGSKG